MENKTKFFHSPFVADNIIYQTLKTYTSAISLFIQYNDLDKMDSTIHTNYTKYNIKISYNNLKNYINKLEKIQITKPVNTIHKIDFSKTSIAPSSSPSSSPSPSPSPNLKNVIMWGSDDLKSLIQKQIPVIHKQIYEDGKSNEGVLKFVVLYLFGGFYYLKDKNPIQIPENSHSELMVTDDYIYSARKYHPFLKYCIKGFLGQR